MAKPELLKNILPAVMQRSKARKHPRHKKKNRAKKGLDVKAGKANAK